MKMICNHKQIGHYSTNESSRRTSHGTSNTGCKIINLEKRNDEIASVCKVLSESVDENLQDDNVTEVAE